MLNKILDKQQILLAFALNERSFLFISLGKKRVKLIPAHMSRGSLHAVAILALWSLKAVEVN